MPDQNLGAWVTEKTGRKMELWKGNCYVHVEFTRERDRANQGAIPRGARRRAPGMHLRRAHAGGRGLLDGKDDRLLQGIARPGVHHRHGIGHAPPAAAGDPGEDIHRRPHRQCACADCRFMKMNTLEKLHDSLLESGAGDRAAGERPRPRGNTDPPDAGVERLRCGEHGLRRKFGFAFEFKKSHCLRSTIS